MRALETEDSPLILRELVKLAMAENARLRARIKEIEDAKNTAEQISFSFEESLAVLRKKFFGKSSERSQNRDKDDKDAELLLHSQNILPNLGKKKTRDLPETVEEVVASEAELKAMSEMLGIENPTADQWEKLSGVFEVSTEITVTERVYSKKKIKKQKYKLRPAFTQQASEDQTQTHIYTAQGTKKLLPGTCYSSTFALSVVIDKYVNHLPLERQARVMDSLGLHGIKTQSLWGLVWVVAQYYENVVERIKSEILSKALVHSDETPWPITNGKDSNGYMWILANQAGAFYRFEPTRSGKVAKESLGDFNGFLMCDDYAGYAQFKKQESTLCGKVAHCHSHARRYFKDIEENYPEVEEYLVWYEKLFSIEHQGRSFEELHLLRQEKSKPLIEKMKAWLLNTLVKVRPKSLLDKAIRYSLDNWRELTLFLDHPKVPLSNNEAERSLRQAVMGRKNFHGSRSINGADAAATLYTIIESCKRLGMEPRFYFHETLPRIINGDKALTPYELALGKSAH